ncbi:MAG: TVP38/TMEM64 family protein [Alphaproteobacteria bacterium]|jgi:uncharacterized membrane protein YdjX (TVP38/TMEM64 family)|nr:TVP38/TMEM64 family protein [Alphaproteobacteria bacterium]MDP6238971.1 TVP38/TMEM64 family protein [Alphaproteobacteria bacterium]MDP7173022.1 TVP38/TMEM64 family protein [Alphaproteobacteria bacterium]MDP7232532.1 TVP38/TMEM64 family protein [Alphaproteobacteria bacterium]HJN20782.1 TVP38/TMEM64 family protein [Alphaproteobacteria bacterium]
MTGDSTTSYSDSEAPPPKALWRRLLPAALLLCALALALVLGIDDYLSFATLRDNHALLLKHVAQLGILAGIVYIAIYIVVVALSFPGAIFLTLSSGFLFGVVEGAFYSVIGATLGATVIFLVARTAVGDTLSRRAAPALQRMEQGFHKNALSYLLVLRLIPLFPFWLVNLVPALLGVSLRIYMLGTFFGIIPGSFVYSLTGASLGSAFESHENFTLAGILTPVMIMALVGLAALSMLPVLYKRLYWMHEK